MQPEAAATAAQEQAGNSTFQASGSALNRQPEIVRERKPKLLLALAKLAKERDTQNQVSSCFQ
jgi:hypothetical protein